MAHFVRLSKTERLRDISALGIAGLKPSWNWSITCFSHFHENLNSKVFKLQNAIYMSSGIIGRDCEVN